MKMSINQHWNKPIKIKEIFSVTQSIEIKCFFQQLFSKFTGSSLVLAHLLINNIYRQESCETKRNSQEKEG
jgi:hypothetical protein